MQQQVSKATCGHLGWQLWYVDKSSWGFPLLTCICNIFTRKVPYAEIPSIPAVVLKVMERSPIRPSPETTCSRMTEEWWEICFACWHRDPMQRPPITDVLSRIRHIQEVHFLLLWATSFYRAFLQGAAPSVSSQCYHLDTRYNTPSHSEVFPESGNFSMQCQPCVLSALVFLWMSAVTYLSLLRRLVRSAPSVCAYAALTYIQAMYTCGRNHNSSCDPALR